MPRPPHHRGGRRRDPAGLAARARTGVPHRRAGSHPRRGAPLRPRRVHRLGGRDRAHARPLPAARLPARPCAGAVRSGARDPGGAQPSSAPLCRDRERPGVPPRRRTRGPLPRGASSARRRSRALDLPLTQAQLAARLGTVRELVARALAELQRSGVIARTHSTIVIRDPERLAALARGEASEAV